ncbi:MAG: ribokinase [Candidatus Limnocylindrales bacterium]
MSGRVIVVGSVNADLVVRGERLPGPGETVTGGSFERHHGGKGGNQAVAAARLGAATLLLGAIGDDALGAEARSALVAADVDVARLATIRGTPTGVALILVDGVGENLISVAPGANAGLTAEMVVEAFSRLGPLAGDVVLVSREIPPVAARQALRCGRDAGARTILNPAPAGGIEEVDLGLADLLTPNRGELATTVAAVGRGSAPGDPNGDPTALAQTLAGPDLVREAVIVTLGAGGALLVPADGSEPVQVPAQPIRPIDTTGAGDAFCGALAAALATGHPLLDAVRRAVVAAGLSTLLPGARDGMPTSVELDRALEAARSGS